MRPRAHRQATHRFIIMVIFALLVATLQVSSQPKGVPTATPSSPAPVVSPSANSTPSASPTSAIVPSKPIVPAEPEPQASATPKPNARDIGILVSDTGNHRIICIQDMKGKNLKSFGFPGHGIGRLLNPAQVWVDHLGRIYIADKGNHRIIRMDNMTGLGWSEMDGFDSPEGVAVNGKQVIVSDSATHKVSIYSDFGGNLTQTLSDPRLHNPGHIWVDDKGEIYVSCGSDPPGGRVVKLVNPGDANGTKWQVFDGKGLKGVGFLPSQVVTQNGDIWMADSSSSRLVRCENMDGKSAREAGGFGQRIGRFQNPLGMAVDQKGNLYVADTQNDRIIFLPGTAASDPTQWAGWSGHSNDNESISLRNPSSIFVWNPSPPPPPDEDEDGKDGKKGKKPKGKGTTPK